MQELIDQLAHDGYEVREVIPDGKIHRFQVDRKDSKNSGYYLCYRNFSERSGEEFYVLVYGSWRDTSPKTYCSLKGKLSADEKKLVKKKIDALKKKEEAEREKRHEEAAQECQRLWDSLCDTGESAYLLRKKIEGIRGLGIKFDKEGNIYVPARDINGKIWSLQRITGNGFKSFFPGGRIRNCFHIVGIAKDQSTTNIAEGFATAASISGALAGECICSFNSSNLDNVSRIIKQQRPQSAIRICGDEDLWTEIPPNPGRNAAERAAKSVSGIAVFPRFRELGSEKPTDWNDLHVREGLEVVSAQILPVVPQKHFVVPLGFKEKEYFFTSSQNRQVISFNKFSESEMLGLMPIEYWESVYPGGGAARVDWTEARSQLMAQARVKGIFQSRNVRGTGVWNDESHVVVNMGDHLVVDGNRVDLGSIKSRYFYTLGPALNPLRMDYLQLQECGALVDACDLIRWKNPDHGFLMAGALVLSRICGALPVRPHVWITAPMGEGKTTIHNRLIRPILGEFAQTVTGSTTEAYVRQVMENAAAPLMFDEFETTDQRSAERIQSLLSLMRSSWDNSGSGVGRGGAAGAPIIYYPRFSAFVFSIRVNLIQDADKSRFATLELAPHKSDKAHWSKLDSILDKIDNVYGDRLFSRTVRMMPILLLNYKRLRAAFEVGASSRFKDQYGMLLAGYSTLLQDDPIDDVLAKKLVAHVRLLDEREESRVTDQENCLNTLLGKKISIETIDSKSSYKKEFSIGEAIEEAILGAGPIRDIQKGLQRFGIRVDSNFVAIAANGHPELEAQIYRGSRWSQNWCNSLIRLPGATRGNPMKIGGVLSRPVTLPIALFQSKL